MEIYTFEEDYDYFYKSKKIQYIITDKGCYECISHFKENFGYFSIIRNGRREKLHRYVYRITHGEEIPDDLVVRHKCDNPSCINPKHLELGTVLDNIRDRDERNRTARQKGSTNAMSKIDEETVIKIILDKEHTQYELAEMYGLSQIHISQIQTGKRWGYLTEQFNCYREKVEKRILSDEEIIEIFLDKDTSTRQLGKKYGVSESVISNIRNGKRHTSLTSKYTKGELFNAK